MSDSDRANYYYCRFQSAISVTVSFNYGPYEFQLEEHPALKKALSNALLKDAKAGKEKHNA